MAKLALVAALLALSACVAFAKEKPTTKWSCKKPSLSFKAKLAGAPNPSSKSGKQYPVGSFEVCLIDGKKGLNPKINVKQNIQGVNNYNGYKLGVALPSFEADFALDSANATNNTNSTGGLPIIQCDPNVETVTKCVAQQVSMAGYTTNPLQRDEESANAALVVFVNTGLCNPPPTFPKGVPKTARAATIAILANGDLTKGYAPTYFTAPKNALCSL